MQRTNRSLAARDYAMLIQQLQRTVLIPSPSSIDTPSPRPDRRGYGPDELPACKHLPILLVQWAPKFPLASPCLSSDLLHQPSIRRTQAAPPFRTASRAQPQVRACSVPLPPAGQHQAMIHSCLENSASCLHQLSHLLSLSLPVPPFPALSRDLEPKHHHTRFRQHPRLLVTTHTFRSLSPPISHKFGALKNCNHHPQRGGTYACFPVPFRSLSHRRAGCLAGGTWHEGGPGKPPKIFLPSP